MSDDEEPKLTFDPEGPGVVKSSCEFCGQTYYIDPENYQIAHELPMCPEFEAIEPLEFVIKNRKLKEAKRPNFGAN